jgi:hypothetical protein
LQYIGKVDRSFSEVQILKAIELGDNTNTYLLTTLPFIVSVFDIGFGSSSTAIVATEYLKNKAD